MWHNEKTLAQALDAAQKIADRAKTEGRSLTADERAECQRHLVTAEDARDTLKVIEQIDGVRGFGGTGSSAGQRLGFGDALVSAIPPGAELGKSLFTVDVPPTWLVKAPTIPAIGDLSRNAPAIVPMGYDRRWLYPNLVRQDLGDALSIQDFSQTVRTVDGTVERSPVATSAKATLDTTTVLVNEAVKQQAIVLDAIPLALLESVNGMRDWFRAEGEFQIQKAIDTHVFAQVVASSPPFGQSGATLIEKLRNGITAMRAEGAEPDVAVLNPADSASLDLSADAGGFVFPVRDSGVANPLWGLKVVERTSAAGNEPPYLLDSRMLGVLYLGPSRVDLDPYAGTGGLNFSKNLVDIRVEQLVLYHVRNAKGARRIAAT